MYQVLAAFVGTRLHSCSCSWTSLAAPPPRLAAKEPDPEAAVSVAGGDLKL